MKDKNGEYLYEGSKVKCFGTIRGIITDIVKKRRYEVAVVTLYEKSGTSEAIIQSEDIKKTYWESPKYEIEQKEKYWKKLRKGG
jgi:hypothetical protein